MTIHTIKGSLMDKRHVVELMSLSKVASRKMVLFGKQVRGISLVGTDTNLSIANQKNMRASCKLLVHEILIYKTIN